MGQPASSPRRTPLDPGLQARSHDRLQGLRGRYASEQCVVLCTGPSVQQLDLSVLDGHPFVMGVNGGYMLRNDFHAYFAGSGGFVRRNAARIAQVKSERLFVRDSAAQACLQAGIDEERLLFFSVPTYAVGTSISCDLTQGLPFGPTVLLTIVLPALLWCGFEEILLIGADYPRRGYSRFYTGSPDAPLSKVQTTVGYENEMELARCRAELWADYLRCHHQKVRVLNCSPSSELDAFERADLSSALR